MVQQQRKTINRHTRKYFHLRAFATFETSCMLHGGNGEFTCTFEPPWILKRMTDSCLHSRLQQFCVYVNFYRGSWVL
jgi:hypothetical protein